jgi:hypothetical protein
MERLRAARYELLMTAFNISLVQGLAAIGRGLHEAVFRIFDARLPPRKKEAAFHAQQLANASPLN